MGSLIMHIAASKKIAEKYNLSDKFIAGSIMPDIYTKCGIDKTITHFIYSEKINLPEYNKYIKMHIENMKDELALGYLAHLIEDYIWFNNFIAKYAKEIPTNPNKIEYLTDNTIHTSEEFSNDIYKDYDFIDNYICEKYNILIKNTKSEILQYFNKYRSNDKLDEYLYMHDFDVNRKNTFITKQDADKFIEISCNEVEKIIKDFL